MIFSYKKHNILFNFFVLILTQKLILGIHAISSISVFNTADVANIPYMLALKYNR